MSDFESIINSFISSNDNNYSIYNAIKNFNPDGDDDLEIINSLNAAFLILLSGHEHPLSDKAEIFLSKMIDSTAWKDIAEFYDKGISLVKTEIESAEKKSPDFRNRLKVLSRSLSSEEAAAADKIVEKIWSVFFPEGVSIQSDKSRMAAELRRKRTIEIEELNRNPVSDPSHILFTSNVLLTIPSESEKIDDLQLSSGLKEELKSIVDEPQLYWYDHPIQIGVGPDGNEVLYGLDGLYKAIEYERDRGNIGPDSRPICVLSVSVTHKGLQKIAKQYLEEEFSRYCSLRNIDVYVFTEADAENIIEEILVPAREGFLSEAEAENHFDVFGVDGEYGRHYSFLKAITAFWNVFIQPEIKSTFKIDLDQVFPQEKLVSETGLSAFEHLMTPLWGARGSDSSGRTVELGMIAGALVNQKDIDKSVYTPDVTFPGKEPAYDEHVFYSILPQALSTEAEMLTRYDNELDGKSNCIQRIHVTGGTVGILVDSLFKYRPFTPSFIGRAEDQAYILSVLNNADNRLAYVHKDGLIMRHDKEAFAQEAIEKAYIGKLIGDYIRILYFSAYAETLSTETKDIKDIVDPFTGCFISQIPLTVVYLRFALKAASFFDNGKVEQGMEFIKTGIERLNSAIEFSGGENSSLKTQYDKEKSEWNLFYDILAAAGKAIVEKDDFALGLQEKAKRILDKCVIHC